MAIEMGTVAELAGLELPRVPTGIDWFDRVLGGGMVPGKVAMLSGDPGAGKSTLLGQLAGTVRGSVYLTGEEAKEAVATRMERLGHRGGDTLLAEAREFDTDALLGAAAEVAPTLVIVDSVQAMRVDGVGGRTGSPRQLVAVAQECVDYARATGAFLVVVCHRTKAGQAAGPRTVEHAVDMHLVLDVGPDGLRRFGAVKNRYGSTAEFAELDMGVAGLSERGGAGLDRAPRGRRWWLPRAAAVALLALLALLFGMGGH